MNDGVKRFVHIQITAETSTDSDFEWYSGDASGWGVEEDELYCN